MSQVMRQASVRGSHKRCASYSDLPLRIDQAQILRDDPSTWEVSIEISQLFRLIVETRIDFIPEAKVEGEIACDFPIVLNKAAIVVSIRFAIGTVLSDLHVHGKTEQKVD